MIMLNKITGFLKKDTFRKIIVLVILGLILYYFSVAGYKGDEINNMTFGRYIASGYRPFLDFFEFHGELLGQFIAGALRIGIPSALFIIGFKSTSLFLYILIIFNIIKVGQKREKLIFGISKNIDAVLILFISSIVGFTLTYSAIIQDTPMIILCLLSFYFLLKGGAKNMLIAGIFGGISIICLQKAIFILPLIYILSLDKDCLKNYRKTLRDMFLYGISLILFIVIFVLIRYRNYSMHDLGIVKESLFSLAALIQSPAKVISFLTSGINGLISLIYLMPGLLIFILSKKKIVITFVVYMIVQLLLMKYIMNTLPLTIIRYFFIFFCLTPIYFTYDRFNAKYKIKMLFLSVIFLSTYMVTIMAANYYNMSELPCPTIYKMMQDNIKTNKKMFYDVACPYFNNEFLIEAFKEQNFLLNNKFDVSRRIYNIKYEDIQKLPYLKDKFSLESEKIYNSNKHLYVYASGCTNIIKIGSFEEEKKDTSSPFSMKCIPIVSKIIKYYDRFKH